jgi:hypothetical protein
LFLSTQRRAFFVLFRTHAAVIPVKKRLEKGRRPFGLLPESAAEDTRAKWLRRPLGGV